jgi:hypothetical protein
VQEALFNSLECCWCGEKSNIHDLVLCTSCPPNDAVRPYYCYKFCAECKHARGCEHKTCWAQHFVPNPRQPDRQHRQTNALHDVFIRVIMYSEANDNKQKRLHDFDRKAEWFRVNLATMESQDADPLLQISDRFRALCKPGKQENKWNSAQYPSFVSFVGDTGVGKSTLVNAMITIGRIENIKKSNGDTLVNLPRPQLDQIVHARSYGPVTRSGNIDQASVPTSVGVHLYRDPTMTQVEYSTDAKETEDVPILFADCEGFRGGNTKTGAERNRDLADSISDLSLARPRSNSTASVQTPGMDPQYITDQIAIRAPDFKNAGKESAELFYARFLYAFSDVVVFVTNEDQKLNDDMRRLLEWAASAVTKSQGRRAQKTLIVVRNGPRLMHDKKFYDADELKRSLFGTFGKVWEHSRKLSDFKAEYDRNSETNEGQIHDNEDFFNIFFQAIKMCYIPLIDKAPPDEIYRQYLQLRSQIVEGTKAGQRIRRYSWQIYNVTAMSHLLTKAFYHFADSNEPFNFYKAARKDNPAPLSISGHMANLLRHIRTSQAKLASFADVVAVCLISYVCRHFMRGMFIVNTFVWPILTPCGSY